MAHYAFIDNNNVVVNVITGVDETVTQIDADGKEVGGSSEAWEAFYKAQLNDPNLFVLRCSYHGNIRGIYPGIGYTYDAQLDEFLAPPQLEPIESDDEQ